MVAVVVGEVDLDCAVVEEFGGSFAFDLVSLVASGPPEGDGVAGIFDLEAGFHGAESDLAALGVIVSVAGPHRSR